MTDSQDTGTCPAPDPPAREVPQLHRRRGPREHGCRDHGAAPPRPRRGQPGRPRRRPAPGPRRTWSPPRWPPGSPGGVVGGGGRTANHTPFTGEKLADLPESTPEDVATAFERARAAQERWAKVPVKQRAAVLLRFHDLVLRRQAEVLDLIQLETGKARLHAHEEVQAVAVAARHYGRKAAVLPQAQGPHRRRTDPHQGHRAPPAARRRRADRPLELPLRAVRGRRPAGLRRGQRRRDEARHGDRADRAVGP